MLCTKNLSLVDYSAIILLALAFPHMVFNIPYTESVNWMVGVYVPCMMVGILPYASEASIRAECFGDLQIVWCGQMPRLLHLA